MTWALLVYTHFPDISKKDSLVCLSVSYDKTRHHNQQQLGRKRFIFMPSSLVMLLPVLLSDFFIIYFSLWLFFAGVLICCLCFTYMNLVWLTCPGSQVTEGSQGKNLEAEPEVKAMEECCLLTGWLSQLSYGTQGASILCAENTCSLAYRPIYTDIFSAEVHLLSYL